MPRIIEILLKLEVFQYDISLNLNMGYFLSDLLRTHVTYEGV